jgi:hypothetical protein
MNTRKILLAVAAGASAVALWQLASRAPSGGSVAEVDPAPPRAEVTARPHRPPPSPPAPAAPPPAPGEPSLTEPSNRVVELAVAAGAPRDELREARLELEVPLREWSLDGEPPRFAFFDGVEHDLVLTAHEPQDGDAGTFVGRVAGAPGSWLVLAHVDDAVAGTIFVPGQGLYRVRTRPGGELRMTLLDPTQFPEELAPLLSGPLADETGEAAPDVAPPPVLDAATVVDLMVVYTQATAAANGGTSGTVALINAAVATSNLAYQNSQVALTLRLVRTQQVTYSESHQLQTDLGRLTSTSDGYLDEIHAVRGQVKADLVSLLVTGSSNAAGVAYLWSPSYGTNFRTMAFSVVVDSYADSNLTLAHELGHNMGCGHAPGDGGGGAYAYSYGHRFTGNNSTAYRTVMAYAPGYRIPYFSNPNVSYQGVATGRPSAGAGPAYNALTLTNSRGTIAQLLTGLSVADQAWIPITAGDFDADGKTDLIWRNSSTGRVIVWYMDAATRLGTAAVWSGDAAWVPVTSADFDADGKTDLVWRNSTSGRVIVWFMNGVNQTSTAAIWTGDAAWVPITAGDFNADGKPDLVWRNSTSGRVIVWFLNGINQTSTAAIWTGDPAWVPIVARDLDGDGKTDLVWRNSSTGRVIAWLLDGVTTLSTTALWTGNATTWVPRAAGPFDGGSTHDLVWRNLADGRVIIWFMNGTTMTSTAAIYQ